MSFLTWSSTCFVTSTIGTKELIGRREAQGRRLRTVWKILYTSTIQVAISSTDALFLVFLLSNLNKTSFSLLWRPFLLSLSTEDTSFKKLLPLSWIFFSSFFLSSLIKQKHPSLDFADFRISILLWSVGLYLLFLALENDDEDEVRWHRMGVADDNDDDELDVEDVE